MNLKRLLYIYVLLIVVGVIVSFLVWIFPLVHKTSKSVSLDNYLNIQTLDLNYKNKGFYSFNPNSDVIALTIIFKGGMALEDTKTKGITNILSKLLLVSKNNKDPNNIQLLLHKYSISFDISADIDNITFNILTTKDNVAVMFNILNLVLHNNNFDTNEFNLAKQEALLNIKLSNYYTSVQASKALYKYVFSNDVKFNNILGSISSINSIKIYDLYKIKNKLFTKNNILVGVSGNIDKKYLENSLNTSFSKLPTGKTIIFNEKSLNIEGRVINIPIDKSTNSDIYFAMPILGMNDKNSKIALEVINSYLGNGFNSLLVEEVRVKKGLVYTINSSIAKTLYGNFWIIKATTENNKVNKTIDTIKMVLLNLQQKKYPRSSINQVKQYLQNRYIINFDNNQNISYMLAQSLMVNKTINDIYSFNTDIKKLTNKQLYDVTKKYVNLNKLLIIVAGNKI